MALEPRNAPEALRGACAASMESGLPSLRSRPRLVPQDLTLMFVHGIDIEEVLPDRRSWSRVQLETRETGHPERLPAFFAAAPQDDHQDQQPSAQAKQAKAPWRQGCKNERIARLVPGPASRSPK